MRVVASSATVGVTQEHAQESARAVMDAILDCCVNRDGKSMQVRAAADDGAAPVAFAIAIKAAKLPACLQRLKKKGCIAIKSCSFGGGCCLSAQSMFTRLVGNRSSVELFNI
eukprot:1147935-Pelagomonas_calceolata.AAC.4